MSLLSNFLGSTPYISPLEQFLQKFDEKHAKLSASQLTQKLKFQRIAQLRDQEIRKETKTPFWDSF